MCLTRDANLPKTWFIRWGVAVRRQMCRPSRILAWQGILWGTVFLWAVAATSAAAPAEVEADFIVQGRTEYNGTYGLDAELSGIIHHSPLSVGNVALTIDAVGAQLRVVNFPLILTQTTPDSPPGDNRVVTRPPPEEYQNKTFTGVVHLLEQSEKLASYRVLPLDEAKTYGAPLRGVGGVYVSAPFNMLDHPQVDWTDFGTENQHHAVYPRGYTGLMQIPGVAESPLTGDFYVFLYGGAFELAHANGTVETVRTGRWLNEAQSTSDPLGWSRNDVYDRWVLILEAKSATVTLGGPDMGAWLLAARSVEGTLEGDIAFHGVEGRLVVDGKEQQPRQNLTQIIGSLEVQVEYGAQSSRWKVEGEGSFVGIDAQTVASSLGGLGVALKVAAGATLFATLVVPFWSLLHKGVGLVVGRVTRDPLANPVRARLMRAVALQPGITRMELAEQVGISRGNARYHLEVLVSSKAVVVEQPGKIPTYMLNDGSFHFQMERFDGDRVVARKVVSLLTGWRRRIVGALQRHGELDYEGFCQICLKEDYRGPSRSAFTRHAHQLAEQGILRRKVSEGRVYWSLAVDVTPLQGRTRGFRLAMKNDLQGVYEVIAECGAVTVDELLVSIANTRRVSRKQLKRDLRWLWGHGLLDHEVSSGRYAIRHDPI